MRDAVKTLRFLQWGMLASIVFCAGFGEYLGGKPAGGNPSLSYGFTTAGVVLVGIIFVVRRTLVLPSAQSLTVRPDDILSLHHWRNGYVTTYVLCEALALFGLVLRCTGFSFQQGLPFYVGGFILLLFFGPRPPVGSHA